MRFSVCIEMLFRELPFLERMEAVAKVGIQAVEFWSWSDKDIDAIERKKDELGLEVSAFMVEPRAELTDRSQKELFIEALGKTIPIAKRLGTKALLTMAGSEKDDVPRSEQHAIIVEILKAGASLAEEGGVCLVLEPLNILVNHKGYYLYSSHEAAEILREVNSPNVKMLYDIYHQQITEGHLIPTIENYIELIGHFHLADVPGRHEPGTGEINYQNVLRKIDELGYEGFVGLEFLPTKSPDEALREVKALI